MRAARVAAGVCCVLALGGIDVGIASRHWLTDGNIVSGLIQGQTHGVTWWNTRLIDVARDMHESTTPQLAVVASGIVTMVLAGLAGLVLAIAMGVCDRRPRGARRCARVAQLLAVLSAASAVAFVSLYPVLHMVPSWSAIVFAGGIVAALVGASAVRAIARDAAPA